MKAPLALITCAQCGREYLGRFGGKYCGYKCQQDAVVEARRLARAGLTTERPRPCLKKSKCLNIRLPEEAIEHLEKIVFAGQSWSSAIASVILHHKEATARRSPRA